MKRLLLVFYAFQPYPTWERLILGRPIGACAMDSYPSWKKFLVYASYSRWIRDNPRSLSYAAATALDFISEKASEARVDVLVDPTQMADLPESLKKQAHRVWIGQDNRNLISASLLNELKRQSYDAIVLLYLDAIGVGWGTLEKRLKKMGSPIWALNGRKRYFPIDKKWHSRLRWRRLLEYLWIFEIVLATLLLPLGILLSIHDTISRKKLHA